MQRRVAPLKFCTTFQVNCTKSAKFWHLLGLTPAYNPVPGLPWAKFCDEKSDMKLSKMLPLLLTCRSKQLLGLMAYWKNPKIEILFHNLLVLTQTLVTNKTKLWKQRKQKIFAGFDQVLKRTKCCENITVKNENMGFSNRLPLRPTY